MQSTFRAAHILCAFSFLATVFSGHAFDMNGIKSGLKERYYRFWLTHQISTVAEAKVSDWCREGIQVERVAREKVLEKYETPRWVTWASAIIPLQESMFDYAYDIYQKIQLKMDDLMKNIEKEIDSNVLSKDSSIALEEQQAAWRALEQKLIYVLGAKNTNIDVTEKNILDNTKEALAIVDALIRILPDLRFALPAPTTLMRVPKPTIRTQNKKAFQDVVAQKEKTAGKVIQFQENQQSLDLKTEKLKKEAEGVRASLGNLIGKDLCDAEIIAKKRLSSIERWHRKKQAEWLADYVRNICHACAISRR